MRYRVFVTDEAGDEALHTYLWDEDKLQSLGDDLLYELENCYAKIAVRPL